MAVPSEIRQILREIKLVRSPVGRMKLLARAWKAFSRLKPWERKRIATRLGLQQFESILEGLSSREGGMVPDEIVDALDGIGEVEPAKVGEVVRQLKDPRRRRDLARRGLSKLTDHLAGADPIAAGAGVAAMGAATAESTESASTSAEPIEEAAPTPEEIPAEPEPIRITPPEPEPPAPEIPASPHPLAGPVERIAAEANLSRKFRLFRELLLDEEELSGAAARRILAAFPEGWARRRVLAAILEEGIPERFEEAFDLILELQNATGRRWCAAALLRSRDLTKEEAARLGEAFSSPAMRRRIAHLAG